MKWDKELVDAIDRAHGQPAGGTLDTDRCDESACRHPERPRGCVGRESRASLRRGTSIGTSGYPSMFEPIHGSAFDIIGKGLANPIGTFWSVVMLLEHLGEIEAAKRA